LKLLFSFQMLGSLRFFSFLAPLQATRGWLLSFMSLNKYKDENLIFNKIKIKMKEKKRKEKKRKEKKRKEKKEKKRQLY